MAEAVETRTRWAVVHRVTAGRRRLAILRLVVSGVPYGLSRARIREILDDHGYDGLLSVAGIPWANHTLIEESHWPEVWDAGEQPLPPIDWHTIADPAAEIPGRRITVVLTPRQWSSARLAADREGKSLNAWAVAAIVAAAAPHEAGVSIPLDDEAAS